MSDLLNKYIEKRDEFIALLIKYYPAHEDWLARQSPARTGDIRKIYKDMRTALKQMEVIAQQRMKERRVEWGATHRVKKDKNNESNDSSN